jgi:hypothetical protein
MADPSRNTPKGARATLLDLRRIIAGVLLLYGVILTVAGIVASDADKEKAAGVNVNLWTGLALIVAGGLFAFWSLARPLEEQLDEPDAGAGDDA